MTRFIHRRISGVVRASTAIGGSLALAACASRPPEISHVVFLSLHDPGDAPELLADCDRLLAPIPSVATYAAGPHIDVGRPSVLHDYDIGLIVGFDSPEAYTEYVEHPSHVALVESWRPRLASLRVYDIHDPTP